MNKVTVETKETKKERTYWIGMIGTIDGDHYILGCLDFGEVGLINIHNGGRWAPQKKVGDLSAITQAEMDRIAPGFPPLRAGVRRQDRGWGMTRYQVGDIVWLCKEQGIIRVVTEVTIKVGA